MSSINGAFQVLHELNLRDPFQAKVPLPAIEESHWNENTDVKAHEHLAHGLVVHVVWVLSSMVNEHPHVEIRHKQVEQEQQEVSLVIYTPLNCWSKDSDGPCWALSCLRHCSGGTLEVSEATEASLFLHQLLRGKNISVTEYPIYVLNLSVCSSYALGVPWGHLPPPNLELCQTFCSPNLGSLDAIFEVYSEFSKLSLLPFPGNHKTLPASQGWLVQLRCNWIARWRE